MPIFYSITYIVAGTMLFACSTVPLEPGCPDIDKAQIRGEQPPRPFKTDGCTLAPDIDFICCCVEHDFIYWQGGTIEERREADMVFRQCIIDKGHPYLANVYYAGVRIFGSPYLPVYWRWGFGWPYGRGYEKGDR